MDGGEDTWRHRFWELLYNRLYSPEPMYSLLKELDQLRDLNHKQAARIAELEFLLSFIRRVGDGVYISDHARLMRLYRFYRDHKGKPVTQRIINE